MASSLCDGRRPRRGAGVSLDAEEGEEVVALLASIEGGEEAEGGEFGAAVSSSVWRSHSHVRRAATTLAVIAAFGAAGALALVGFSDAFTFVGGGGGVVRLDGNTSIAKAAAQAETSPSSSELPESPEEAASEEAMKAGRTKAAGAAPESPTSVEPSESATEAAATREDAARKGRESSEASPKSTEATESQKETALEKAKEAGDDKEATGAPKAPMRVESSESATEAAAAEEAASKGRVTSEVAPKSAEATESSTEAATAGVKQASASADASSEAARSSTESAAPPPRAAPAEPEIARDGSHADADAGIGRAGSDSASDAAALPTTCEGCMMRHSGIRPFEMQPKAIRAAEDGTGPDYAVKIDWFGNTVTKYFPGAKIFDDGRSFELLSDPEKGYSLFNELGSDTDYTRIPLAGNRLTVNVSFSVPGPSCGCNVAFFLVSAPSKEKSEWGNYYCDANCVGGNCCAEFDLMEMNLNSMVVTSHECSDYQTPPFNSQPWACDHVGAPQLVFGNGKKDFGPGPGFTIDSQKPFQFSAEFPEENGILKAVIAISQGNTQVVGTMDNLENMRGPLTDGMALDLDSWFSDNIQWLDGGVCPLPEKCNRAPTTFSHIVLEHIDGPTPTPAPPTPTPPAPPMPVPPPTPSTPAPSTTPAPVPTPAPPAKDCPKVPDGWLGYCDWIERQGCDNVVDDGSLYFCRCCCEEISKPCQWKK